MSEAPGAVRCSGTGVWYSHKEPPHDCDMRSTRYTYFTRLPNSDAVKPEWRGRQMETAIWIFEERKPDAAFDALLNRWNLDCRCSANPDAQWQYSRSPFEATPRANADTQP